MNRPKTSYRNRPLLFPKIVLMSFLFFGLLLFANPVIAQGSSHNGGQWGSVGGRKLISGEGHFSNKWSAATRYAHGDGKYWKNDEPTSNKTTGKKIPATHTREEVTKDVWSRQGQITVRGPGYLGLFMRTKGAGAALKFPKSGKVFHAQGLGKDEWVWYHGPNGREYKWQPGEVFNADPTNPNLMGGWVPAGRETTLDVWVYNPFSEWGIWGNGYDAPKSVEYEFWFFPQPDARIGGGIVKVIKNCPNGEEIDITIGDIPCKTVTPKSIAVTSGKTVKENIDNLPPGAAGYVMSIIGSKKGKVIRERTGETALAPHTLKEGDVIYFNDVIKTEGVMVKVILNYPHMPLVVLKPDTRVRLEKRTKHKHGGIFAFFGKLLFNSDGRDHRGFKIITSNAITSVEGTEFETAYTPNTGETTVSVFEGTVRLDCTKGKAKPIMVKAGMQATMNDNCNNTLSILDPDNNTPAKTGWEVDGEPNDTPPGGGSGGAAQGTARLLTASSNRDMVGRNEIFRGNGKTDAIFRAQFSAPNRMVTAVEVSNTNGVRSVWDTRPNNRLWLGGVVIGGRTMNRSDGSVNFSLGSGQNTLDFYVEDNGSIRGGKTNYRMTIFFAGGDPVVMNIVPGGGGPGSSSSNTQTGTQHPPGDITKTTGTGPTGLTLDFETGRTNGWVKTGTAFDHQPTYGDNPTARHRGQPSKHVGNFWIGTYEKYQGHGSQTPGSVQGDGPTGTLTSNVFTIPTGSLSFLVGGGSSFQTRIELLVSGNRVLSVSGRGTETMHRVKWDLNPWAGQQGQIRLVDNASGGWGHINADDFRYAKLLSASKSNSGGSAKCGLGKSWDVTEVYGWTGRWIRQGNSNVFDGLWTLGGKQEKAVLTININGNTVNVKRKQSAGSSYPGQECTYKGILAADNVTVTGTYGCAWAAGPFNWQATIRCDSGGGSTSTTGSLPPSQGIKKVITGYGKKK